MDSWTQKYMWGIKETTSLNKINEDSNYFLTYPSLLSSLIMQAMHSTDLPTISTNNIDSHLNNIQLSILFGVQNLLQWSWLLLLQMLFNSQAGLV